MPCAIERAYPSLTSRSIPQVGQHALLELTTKRIESWNLTYATCGAAFCAGCRRNQNNRIAAHRRAKPTASRHASGEFATHPCQGACMQQSWHGTLSTDPIGCFWAVMHARTWPPVFPNARARLRGGCSTPRRRDFPMFCSIHNFLHCSTGWLLPWQAHSLDCRCTHTCSYPPWRTTKLPSLNPANNKHSTKDVRMREVRWS